MSTWGTLVIAFGMLILIAAGMMALGAASNVALMVLMGLILVVGGTIIIGVADIRTRLDVIARLLTKPDT